MTVLKFAQQQSNQAWNINCENWTLEKIVELLGSLQEMKGCRITLTFGNEENVNKKTEERVLGQYLNKLGFAPHLRGYSYLKTGIRHCIETPQEMESVTKLLYPAIAREHNTTAARVEHGIRHAIAQAWDGRDEEEWGSVFGFRNSRRPSNSEFLAALTDYIYMAG